MVVLLSSRYPGRLGLLGRWSKKKADVVEHPEVFRHVGLLVNGLPGSAELPFI
jgi:hypothetical protein